MTTLTLTLDAEAHSQLEEAVRWYHARPSMLTIEGYENDQSQVKMIGFILDRMYEEDIAEQADGDCSWFTRVWFKDTTLMVTDWENRDYEIKVKGA